MGYIGRRMRIFIHTGIETSESSATRVSRDENGNKTLVNRAAVMAIPFDDKLLSYPVGSYVGKKNKIIHLYIIPQSEWHNPFKVKKKNKRKQVINEYEEYLIANKVLMKKLSELGQYSEIGCWCTPKGCHGDTILSQYHKLKNKNSKNRKRKRIKNEIVSPPKKRRKIDDTDESDEDSDEDVTINQRIKKLNKKKDVRKQKNCSQIIGDGLTICIFCSV